MDEIQSAVSAIVGHGGRMVAILHALEDGLPEPDEDFDDGEEEDEENVSARPLLHQRVAFAVEAYRMAENSQIAQGFGRHALRHLQELHLLVGKGLVDLVDGTAGHTRCVEQFDPLGTGLLARYWQEHLHHLMPIVETRLRGRKARIGEQVLAFDSTAKTLIEIVGLQGAMKLRSAE